MVLLPMLQIYSQLVYPSGSLRERDIVTWINLTATDGAPVVIANTTSHYVNGPYWASGQTLSRASSVNLSGIHLTGTAVRSKPVAK